MQNEALTLDASDPAVIAARNAEASLYQHYGLQAKDHYIPIPGYDLKMRISEIGSGEPVLVVSVTPAMYLPWRLFLPK